MKVFAFNIINVFLNVKSDAESSFQQFSKINIHVLQNFLYTNVSILNF